MNQDVNTALADLAVRFPNASRVLHRRGLDYCCGGRRPLAEACQDRGLDPAEILAEIQGTASSADGPAWDIRPAAELVAHIVERYHEDLRRELPDLVALATKVEDRHADKASCPRGLKDHLAQIHSSVLEHLAKEEQVLFPLILSGNGPFAGGPVHVMEMEHRDHARNLQRTRELTHDFVAPPEACASWQALYLRLAQLESDLMEHIHLENNVLFPRALRES